MSVEASPAGAVARGLWERMEARDWAGVRELLGDGFVLEWPQSGERIRGRDNFLAVNQNYPGEWHIDVDRVVAAGDEAVTRVTVAFRERPGEQFPAVSFFTIAGGRIARVVEYWPDPFAPADWRAAWVERY